MCNSKVRASMAVSTTGKRMEVLACTTSSSSGKATPSTCLYKAKIAALAWFWSMQTLGAAPPNASKKPQPPPHSSLADAACRETESSAVPNRHKPSWCECCTGVCAGGHANDPVAWSLRQPLLRQKRWVQNDRKTRSSRKFWVCLNAIISVLSLCTNGYIFFGRPICLRWLSSNSS